MTSNALRSERTKIHLDPRRPRGVGPNPPMGGFGTYPSRLGLSGLRIVRTVLDLDEDEQPSRPHQRTAGPSTGIIAHPPTPGRESPWPPERVAGSEKAPGSPTRAV